MAFAVVESMPVRSAGPPAGGRLGLRRALGGACNAAPNPPRVTVADEHLGHALALDRYRLGRRLGAGGFGAVHEAFDERLERWVAVKVIPTDGPAPERARREAKAAARLDHPGIVALFDAGEEPHARYLVSELVDGPTMAALQAEGALTDRDVLRIGLALCDALEHAHGRGVVHRDVKPQNVLVPGDPRTWRAAAKLADFGVASLAGDDPLTHTGDVVGTLAYMAPEQAAGEHVDERADLYATALVLYEGLAGVNPVRGANPAETARRLGKAIGPLHRRRPDLPEELCAALDRALRVDPDERGTLADLGDALEAALLDVPDEEGAVAVTHPVERPWLLPPVPRGAPRIAHALLTGALVAGTFAWLGRDAHVPWIAAALAVGLVALLPRVGWVLAVGGTMAGLVAGPAALGGSEGVAAAGTAVLLVLATAPVPFLLARLPRAWSAAALAPLLGVVGLAGAFPAVAGRAAAALERAALGALGAWWLLLAEPAAAQTLLLGPVHGVSSGTSVQEAISIAVGAAGATIASGLPLLMVAWALAAVVLPWLVRGWNLALDVVLAAAWAAGLAAATAGIATLLAAELPVAEPKGVVAGSIVAGIAAVWGARAPESRYSAHDDDE